MNYQMTFMLCNDVLKPIKHVNYIGSCQSCGRRHPGECWHKDAICNKCGDKGHIERACTNKSSVNMKYDKTTSDQEKQGARPGANVGVYKVDEYDSSSNDEVECNALSVHKNTGECKIDSASIMLRVLLNGKEHKMELDTGSAVSLISYNDAKVLFQPMNITDTNVILKTYTGETNQAARSYGCSSPVWRSM